MTSGFDVLLTVASWEDRFRDGLITTLGRHRIGSVGMIFSAAYADETESNRTAVIAACGEHAVPISPEQLDFDDAPRCWKGLQAWLPTIVGPQSRVLFDISTSPREIAWFVLHHLRNIECQIHYHYYRPTNYGDWQSRDAALPRLVFRRSGISLPDRPTAIVAITGFDSDRVAQIINRFEPAVVLLGVQKGEQYDNAVRNAGMHRKKFGSNPSVHFFEFDAYAPCTELVAVIREQLEPYCDKYNILATSLGPKPSAVGLFKLAEELPDVGLIYTPSLEYNPKYSTGIDIDAECSGRIFEA